MARRFILADDLDDTESTEENPVLTWQFSFGPRNQQQTYSIDLTEANYAQLTEALDKFVKVAEPVQVGRQPSQVTSTGTGRGRGPNRTPEQIEEERKAKEDKAAQREEIVAWGKANEGDFNVNDSGRGRLDTKLIDAFYKANKSADRLH